MHLPSGREAILSDTVGFISDLPHQLVNAFKVTPPPPPIPPTPHLLFVPCFPGPASTTHPCKVALCLLAASYSTLVITFYALFTVSSVSLLGFWILKHDLTLYSRQALLRDPCEVHGSFL